MNKQMENDSKYLSYLLRHHPEDAKCTIDEYGWVNVDTLVTNSKFSLEYLKEIVENDTRYTFSDDFKKIRAFHGHSIKGIIYQNEEIPPTYLYHGTSLENYEKIKQSGFIKGMSRTQVHLSISEENAKKIGARHGKPIVLKINCETMINDGFKFYMSGDGVWLTSNIPIKYIMSN